MAWLGQEDEDARRGAGILGELGPALEAYSDPTLGSLKDTYPRFSDKLWSEKLGGFVLNVACLKVLCRSCSLICLRGAC